MTYDGLDAPTLAQRLGVPHADVHEAVGSTMDVAHHLAERGAAAGTIVLADRQTAGRGRGGRRWASPEGSGIWLTLVERPAATDTLTVLSLRIGLAAAPVLDAFADRPVRLKWPNDLYLGQRKLAGVLVEARWQGARPAWVAIGVGLNVVAPAEAPLAAGLRPGTARLDVLGALVPALRAAAARHGPLDGAELDAFAARDLARGRRCLQPVAGRVVGIAADGALLVHDGARVVPAHSGSLTFAEEPAEAGTD